jgi:hypothetical protein
MNWLCVFKTNDRLEAKEMFDFGNQHPWIVFNRALLGKLHPFRNPRDYDGKDETETQAARKYYLIKVDRQHFTLYYQEQ